MLVSLVAPPELAAAAAPCARVCILICTRRCASFLNVRLHRVQAQPE